MTIQPHERGSITLKDLLEDPSLKNPPTIGLLSNDHLKVKKEDLCDLPHVNYGSAFLGPNLWDKSQNGTDFNLEYMDLDEFLSENGLPINSEDTLTDIPAENDETSCVLNVPSPMPATPCSQFSQSPLQYLKVSTPISNDEDSSTSISQLNNISPPVIPFTVDFQVNEQDLVLTSTSGDTHFDPRKRNFTEDELKPQPVIKKAKKLFVPEDLKDEKYWARRQKNNFAARRSRDARRVKENQIAMRAAFLEKENSCLRDEMVKLQKENANLKAKVLKYEDNLHKNISLS